MSDAVKPALHGRDHCPGGVDPIPCLNSTSSAYLDTWISNGTGASIGNDNWTNVVTGVDGTNDRWFDQSNVDPSGQWNITFATGAIDTNAGVAYNYAAWGYVTFDVSDGVLIGALLVGMEGAVNLVETADGVTSVTVYAERTPLPVGGVKLQCYQASGGAADILSARLHVRRFEIYEDVYEQSFAT